MPNPAGPITVATDVLYQPLADEVVLLNLNDSRYYGLDDVGGRMWQLLAEHGDPEAVVDRMQGEYEVDEAVLRRDLAVLIGKLEAAGLISVPSS